MKIPGTDAAKNLYNAFNLGFNPRAYFGRSPLKVATSSLNVLSPSGFLTAGGLALGGAAIGAAVGSQMEGDMVGPGAAVGAAAGAAALPLAGAATRVGFEVGKRALPAIGSAVLKAPAIGAAALKGGINLATHAPLAVGPKIGTATAGFASMMVDWNSTKKGMELLDSVKLTNPISGFKAGWESGKGLMKPVHGAAGSLINGQTILWGSSILAGAAGAFNEVNRAHMGQMDGQITRPAPRVLAYDLNAGATGDLVFALNANRRG